MSNKAKGTRAEHKTMRLLETLGYRCTRAAASLGEWDVIAISRREVRLIQVKCGKRPYIHPAERETLESFHTPPGVSREIWYWKDRAPKPRIEEL